MLRYLDEAIRRGIEFPSRAQPDRASIYSCLILCVLLIDRMESRTTSEAHFFLNLYADFSYPTFP